MRSWLSVLITDAESKKVFDIPIAPSLYSLSNKMDNSLLAVRDINHKYIVVENIWRKMLMNGTNGNQPGYPENALVPYPVIVAATKGDPDAMKMVLQHFSGYIARLSMRKLYDERGNVYFGIDNDIRERLQAKLMMAVLNFRTEK